MDAFHGKAAHFDPPTNKNVVERERHSHDGEPRETRPAEDPAKRWLADEPEEAKRTCW